MEMDVLEQGIDLAMEISKLDERTMNYLRTNGKTACVAIVLTAIQKFHNNVGKYVHEEVKQCLREDPELVQRIREEKVIPEDKFNEMVEEANKTGEPASDVDFQPIGEK